MEVRREKVLQSQVLFYRHVQATSLALVKLVGRVSIGRNRKWHHLWFVA